MSDCKLKSNRGRNYYCSMELALQVIGGKWKPLILYHLSRNGTKRFGELRKMMPNITQKMLTQQLRELEHDGLIHRVVYAQVPPKVEYSLSQFGTSILPVLERLSQWGQDYEEKFQDMETLAQ
jgi:DNA-binding HxlR family transcriptional regulator